MPRIPYDRMYNEFSRVLLKYGCTEDRADLCARLFAETSRDGVYSHGLNRFPAFIQGIKDGYIDIHAGPARFGNSGIMERWDGNLGPGNLNAWYSMERAVELAKTHGLGGVALRNTNHWMRGGSYGWQAAQAGVIGLCWTNTIPNLPPWGGKDARLGNNPFVIGIPRAEGHVVIDMAMSQFSYGKLESYRLNEKQLPVAGGYDRQGEFTKDPAAIEQTGRVLPIGYWKGSGLALVLDMVVSLLSEGDASYQIGEKGEEYGISQIFLALALPDAEGGNKQVNAILNFLKQAEIASAEDEVFYPGEQTLRRRAENLEKGIPADSEYWDQVLAL
ncbi:MAG TPA: 3-dehydro-L-gulonate 2-dehydrogenase [bacterium]|nr:3-dehydro-L-gulonate 2-dehydrogenase [bacterium]